MTGARSLLFVAALVAANAIVWALGPKASPFIAFGLIGLDLYLRDAVHAQHGPTRALQLVAVAAALSWVVNPAAGAIALASVLAFLSGGLVDTLVYHLLRRQSAPVRINASNTAAALIDSLLFPTIAFGDLLPGVIALQFVAKVAGGALWAYVLTRKRFA